MGTAVTFYKRMKIIVGDAFSHIETEDLRVAAILRSVCSARPKGYMFMPRYKKGHWDGYVSLSKNLMFPTGLLKRVYRMLKQRNYSDIHIYRKRSIEYREVTEDIIHGITLRDNQIDAANKLLEAKRGIAKMATNSGKTEIFAAMIAAMNIPKTLVLVTRKELMYQTAERLQIRLGVSIGKIGDGVLEDGNVIVAMIQTLSRFDEDELNEHFDGNQVIILDECHHGSAETMLNVLEKISGYHRFGFSGTPLKNDVLSDLKLIAYTGEIVVELSNEELIEQGYSAKPIINVHSIQDSTIHLATSYQLAYSMCIVRGDVRNQMIASIAEDSVGVTLIIVERIDHGNILHNLIQGSMFVNGGDSTEDRQLALDNMRAGVSGTYIATQIFDEGIDVPSIETLILAAGGKSNIRLLQRVGRGLRRKEGINQLIVHDFMDNTNKYLHKHSLARIKIYEQEGFEIVKD